MEDYSFGPLFSWSAGIKSRALNILGKCFTTEASVLPLSHTPIPFLELFLLLLFFFFFKSLDWPGIFCEAQAGLEVVIYCSVLLKGECWNHKPTPLFLGLVNFQAGSSCWHTMEVCLRDTALHLLDLGLLFCSIYGSVRENQDKNFRGGSVRDNQKAPTGPRASSGSRTVMGFTSFSGDWEAMGPSLLPCFSVIFWSFQWPGREEQFSFSVHWWGTRMECGQFYTDKISKDILGTLSWLTVLLH